MSLHHLSFSSPRYLWVLLALPLFFAFTLAIRRRRSRSAVVFTNLRLLAGISSQRPSRWWRRAPMVLLALALAATAAALARPHIRTVTSNRGSTIVLLADVSGSMQATDVRPARIYAAVNAMHDFVDGLPANDRVGLVSFSDKALIRERPTTDHAAVGNGLDVLSPEGGTALGIGVETAIKLIVSTLADAGVRRIPGEYLPAAIVLVSDGAQDRGTVTPFAAAQVAKTTGVRIYGIALGTRHGFITQGSGLLSKSIQVQPDPGVVAMLARESGGEAFDARDASSLNSIYGKLGSSIDRRPELLEVTSWFEIAAAALLVGGVGAARVRGGALP